MKYCALITAAGDKTERSTFSNLSRTEFIDVFVDFNVETCFFVGVSSSSINGFRESSLFLAGGGWYSVGTKWKINPLILKAVSRNILKTNFQ